jgi:hypothetical protein
MSEPISAPATTPPASRGRVETLDLLRLFAALAVVAYHYTFRGFAADDMTWVHVDAVVPVTKYGYLGVQLFFVISGFVIAYSAEGRNARQFFIARAARLYPGFLACMTITFLDGDAVARQCRDRRAAAEATLHGRRLLVDRLRADLLFLGHAAAGGRPLPAPVDVDRRRLAGNLGGQ